MADFNTNNTTTINNSSTATNIIIYGCIHLVMPCAVAIGIIGNLLSILVFARREMIKFCVSIFTIVLALSDILLLITSLFNIILTDYLGGLLSDKSAFWCHFHGYFDLLFAALSGYSVVFISVERWFSVWKPFDKAKYVTFKTTIITVISYISISIIAFSWFPLTLSYNYGKHESSEQCRLARPTVYKIFGTFSVIFTYIAPFIFLGILNTLIVYRLHARHNTSIQRSMATPTNSTTDSTLATASTRKRQRQRNTDRNITFMLIAVAIAFMVMSFPYQIYWFYMQIHQSTPENKTLFTLTQTFRYLNCCCNFFLYSATSSLFRRELREIFQCSISTTSNSKEPTHVQTTIHNRTRTRTPSSLPTYSTNIDNATVERKTLLVTSTSLKISTKPVENVNLIAISNEPINGYSATFKK
ncbi:unnamed protein product [Rotaria sordida]|uniref:G-protein coupled receptors family 1 profile domain-containing protein n=1 Tax=Rotaria sordida TaxID=392033 RepID=A0A819FC47_9BILA|nr:unnamed protein product [Rotaria sordida]CAF0944264.1 unnamed protein product [Rotaria sordida]CAF1062445.1 unnamed protein product [Rotaria sordida]CAF1070583.1 unnamed protein product [Rotaria sordida]CAF1071095.1 unnamed protein product [Rotaria sordida]